MDISMNRLNAHELMKVDKVKVKKGVEKVSKVKPSKSIDKFDSYNPVDNVTRKRQQAYSSVDRLSRSPSVLVAGKIMTSPVVTLQLNHTLQDALNCFKDNHFQHIPVMDHNAQLAGIISERDLFRVLSGMSVTYQQKEVFSLTDRVQELMISDVLTADVNTDVRHIAHTFIEKGIGSMPIMNGAQLQGIITNSDLLNAVMSHYSLEIWA